MSGYDKDAALSAAVIEAQAQIARTDTKASVLLAAIGASLAGLGAAGSAVTLPLAGGVVAGAGVAALIAAAGLLLSVLRPQLKPGTIVRWSTLSPDGVRADLETDHRPVAVAALSRIAVAKHQLLQRAVDTTRAGGVLLAVAALIGIGGAL